MPPSHSRRPYFEIAVGAYAKIIADFVQNLLRRPRSAIVRVLTMHPRREGRGEAMRQNYILNLH